MGQITNYKFFTYWSHFYRRVPVFTSSIIMKTKLKAFKYEYRFIYADNQDLIYSRKYEDISDNAQKNQDI